MGSAFIRGKRLLGSRLSFWLIVLAFIGIAATIALKTAFPMLYDESYHFSLIQLYSHHWSPFLSHQPVGADSLGAVAREPSYLYHYLLSFPYRVIAHFIHSRDGQVLALRLINVLLGVWSLIMLRKLAQRMMLSPIISNIVVAGLAFTPLMLSLTAQLNYDNLLLPVTLLSIYLAWGIGKQLARGKVQMPQLLGLISVMLFGSLVKYSFLPIALAIGVYLIVSIILSIRKRGLGWEQARLSWQSVSRLARVTLVLGIIVSSGLWIQRYGVDILAYKTPHPQCDKVLSVAQCSVYAPWYRNYTMHNAKHFSMGWPVIGFAKLWTKSVYTQVYSIATVHSAKGMFHPVYQLIFAANEIIIVGLAAILYTLRRFFSRRVPWGLLLGVVFTYVAVLWLQNFMDYRNLGQAVGTQGRYLLPVLPIAYLIFGRAYMVLWHRSSQPAAITQPVPQLQPTLTPILFAQKVGALIVPR